MLDIPQHSSPAIPRDIGVRGTSSRVVVTDRIPVVGPDVPELLYEGVVSVVPHFGKQIQLCDLQFSQNVLNSDDGHLRHEKVSPI